MPPEARIGRGGSRKLQVKVPEKLGRSCYRAAMADPASDATTFHPPVPVSTRPLSPVRWLAPFALVALGLRLLPLMTGDLILPRANEAHAAELPDGAANPIEQPGQTFPGSAWFLAEGAFAPPPGKADEAARGLPPEWRGNRHILAIDIGPAALPYRFAARGATDRARALSCLANAIYYEAGNEPEEGQRAVAQVVLNRVRHPAWPDTVCGVVYEGTERDDLRCQFTFSCNGAMARLPDPGRWLRARRVAEEALSGRIFAPAGLATSYHTLSVFPGWAPRMHAAAIIGAHIFYRMPGAAGDPARFRSVYAGVETIPGPSGNAYLAPQTPVAAPVPAADVAMLADAAPQPEPAPAPQIVPAPAGTTRGLPDSQVRAEYRNSGRALD